MGGVQKRKRDDNDDETGVLKLSRRDKQAQAQAQSQPETSTPTDTTRSEPNPPNDENPVKKILTGTTIYINGSTMPLISDHKLKCFLIAHGAKLSLVPARNTITHIIIGRPNANTAGNKGAGGGLAASKVQKEIEKCGRGVKVVGVEWCVLFSFFFWEFLGKMLSLVNRALESIKAEKRLTEARFALNLAPKGQLSVLEMLG